MDGNDKSVFCIKVGQESNNQQQKNNGNLFVKFSYFKSCKINTDGYDSGSELHIQDSTIYASEIKGNYPRSEIINVARCKVFPPAPAQASTYN